MHYTPLGCPAGIRLTCCLTKALSPPQTTVKERYKALNAAIGAIHESQSGWTIPDATLRANLKARMRRGQQACFAQQVSGSLECVDVLPP